MNDQKLWKSIGISLAALVPVLIGTLASGEEAASIAAATVAVLGPVVDKLRRILRSKKQRAAVSQE